MGSLTPQIAGDELKVGARDWRPDVLGTIRIVTNHLDFDTSAPVLAALLAAGIFPAVLAVVCRLPGLRGRNALQFLASSLMLTGLWGFALHVTPGPTPAEREIATSSMILAGALLVYLEAW